MPPCSGPASGPDTTATRVDLYAFQSPADPARTVLILNANPNAGPLHPDAIYRIAVDSDGDYLNDLAITYVFAPPVNGQQTFDVFIATGPEARSAEAAGTKAVEGAAASFGATATVITSDNRTFFAGSRSDAFFFDLEGIENLFDTSGGRNFTAPHLGSHSPWTGTDSNANGNVFSMAAELPTSELRADPDIRIWGRCSLRRDGRLLHVDRAAIPRSAASSTPTRRKRNTTPASPPTTASAGPASSPT